MKDFALEHPKLTTFIIIYWFYVVINIVSITTGHGAITFISFDRCK